MYTGNDPPAERLPWDFLAVSVLNIDLCGVDGGTAGSIYFYQSEVPTSPVAHVLVSGSRFCGDSTSRAIAFSKQGRASMTLLGNVFTGSTYVGYHSGYDSLFTNNLIFSGEHEVGITDGSAMALGATPTGRISLENNTYSDLGSMQIYVYVDDVSGWSMPDVSFSNNIVSSIEVFDDDDAFWSAYWSTADDDSFSWSRLYPSEFLSNDFWDVPTTLFMGEYYYSSSYYPEHEYSTGYSDEMWRVSLNVDPLFTYSETQGSYSLDPTSPCVDAGVGSVDPDATPNDIGAFGGPEGDWWRSYPWPLD